MTPTEWNPEKSTYVLQTYHHWFELISKYESVSSEKIASNIKITLALQNVRGPLASALSLSINEKSTRNDNHTLLINYFNNSIPQAQGRSISSTSRARSQRGFSESSRPKGKVISKKSKGQSNGKASPQNQNQTKRKGEVKGQSKGETKSKGKGQWTTWSGQSWSWSQGQGGKGKGKGQQVCSHCVKVIQ